MAGMPYGANVGSVALEFGVGGEQDASIGQKAVVQTANIYLNPELGGIVVLRIFALRLLAVGLLRLRL